MPLCCSFLGKVPPIGGFRIFHGFLPPTLMRGGKRLLCTVGILRKIFRYSDVISCRSWRGKIFISQRRVGKTAYGRIFRKWRCLDDVPVLQIILFSTQFLLFPVALYHAPRGIRRSCRTTAHIFLHAVGGVTHGIAAFRLLFPLPLVHVLFQKGIGVFRRGVLQLCLWRVHAGFDLQVPHGVTPHRAWLTLGGTVLYFWAAHWRKARWPRLP